MSVSSCLVILAWIAFEPTAAAETWRDLTVAPEERCSPYDRKRHYPYPQSIEHDIVRELGAVYGPYISERTREGIAAARKRGRTPGRPPLGHEMISAAQKLIEVGLSHGRAEKQLGIGSATAYRIAATIRERRSSPESGGRREHVTDPPSDRDPA